MGASPAAVPPRAGWWGPVLGLLALIVLPVLPPTHLLVPISPATILLIPALAACAVLGWQAGASVALAALLVGWSAWMLAHSADGTSAAFSALCRGWSLVLAASFGVVCWAAPTRSFLVRALSAIGVAFMVTAGAVFVGVADAGDQARAMIATELSARNDALFAAMHPDSAGAAGLPLPTADPVALKAFTEVVETWLRAMVPGATTVFPALLALESLGALALAWAIFQRLSRANVGRPLARLREFRFNDQMVWGLALALTALVLPTLAEFRGIGWNLLVFFGCLYAVRGMGVVAWFLPPTRTAMVAALLGFGAFLLPVVAAVALGVLGIGDTWVDWRHRARPSTLT